DCSIEPCIDKLTADLANDVAHRYDLVISAQNDSVDDDVLNAACIRLRKLLLWGNAAGSVAQAAVFAGHRSDAPCLKCMYQPPLPFPAPIEGSAILFTSASGLIGTVLATEAITIILGLAAAPLGRLVRYDADASVVGEEVIRKQAQCGACRDMA